MKRSLLHSWYRTSLQPLTYLLLPFSWLFGWSAALRRYLYRYGVFRTRRFAVPVIVVGNITVGGTGKTPFVIWLANWLRSQGYQPGMVSRGVGGELQRSPYQVQPNDAPAKVGDEALLLLENTQCPLVLCMDRAAAVDYLLQQCACNVVISDDGLQHYGLGRDLEIVIVDGERQWGNGHLLPAGPLREPLSRLQSVDMIIVNGPGNVGVPAYRMTLTDARCISLLDAQQTIPLSDYPHQRVHAVAGIGHPQRFFSLLAQAGLDLIPHIFADHYLYQANDFAFTPQIPILMTEKDAVKCRAFANERFWYVRVSATVQEAVAQVLLNKLTQLSKR